MSQNSPAEEAIFEAARQLADPEKQAAYLDRACGKDLALRQRIEQLLHAAQKAKDFFQKQPPLLPPPPPETPTVRTIGEGPGSVIGPYKLLQQIGEGGCGVVYMAEQEEPIRRRVALKVIKLGMDTKQVIARFDAERQALALMDHPNIAKVLDAGATETGRPYFVMELVRGIKITDCCDQNKLSTNERLALFTEVCRAVQHAHQKGIIHRDLKPSNILVASNDGVPVPKVIDFGIAKATQGRLTDQTLFTAFEQFIGTPAYMSPEQAEMTMLDIDTRTDIYALGVLLYELLTGRTPFDAKELLAAGLDEMRRTIREVEPVKPSTRLTELLANDVSRLTTKSQIANRKSQIHADLDWIVMKCLEKDRARRYETANGLALDVQHYLADEPVLARPPSKVYRFQKTVRRNKLAFAAGGAVLAALVIGLGVSTWMFFQEKAARQRAVAAENQANQARSSEAAQRREAEEARADESKLRAQAQTEASKSEQVAELLKKMLQSVGPSVALGRDTALMREILDQTAERIGTDLTNQPEVELELRGTLASTYHELGRYGEMEAMARKRLELARARPGQENLALASSLTGLADALSHLGKLNESERLIREALELHQKILSKHPTAAMASSLEMLAHILAERGDLVEAEKLNRQALALLKKRFGNENAEVAVTFENLAGVLIKERKLDEAETIDREALAILRKVHGNEHPDVATSLHHLGTVLSWENKLTQAETIFRQAVTMRQKLLGNDHPSLANSMDSLADVLRRKGQYQQAEDLERDALKLRRKVFGEDHQAVAHALYDLARLLREKKAFANARSVSEEAVAMYQRHPEWPSKERQDVVWVLAEVLRELGDFGALEAVRRHDLSLLQQASTNGPAGETPILGVALYELAKVLRERKLLADAQALAEEALAAYQRHPDWPLDERGYAFATLGDVLRDRGDFTGREAVLRTALTSARTLSTNAPLGETSSLGLALHNLAHALRERKALTEARSLAEEAAAMYRHHPEWPPNEIEGAFAVLTEVLRDLGDVMGLEAVLRDELTRVRKLAANAPSGETAELARAMYHLADVLRQRKALPEAQSLGEQAVAMFQRHPDWPPSKRQNAVAILEQVLKERGDFGGLEALLQDELGRLRTLCTNAPSGEISNLGVTLSELANVLRKRKSFSQARSLAEEAIAMCQRHPDWPSDERESAFSVLAAVRWDLADKAGAEAAYREILQSLRARLAPEDPALTHMLAQLTMILLEEKKFTQAEPLARECLEIREKKVPDDWRTFNSRSLLGGALLGQKNYADAEPLLLSGYEGMKQREDKIPASGKSRLKETLQRVVQLYAATGRPEQAAEWKKKLAQLDQAER